VGVEELGVKIEHTYWGLRVVAVKLELKDYTGEKLRE